MSNRIDVSGDVLADRLGEFLPTAEMPGVNDWATLIDTMRTENFSGSVSTTEYWIDLYSRRQGTAARLNTGVADELARIVRELAGFKGEMIAFVLITLSGYGYFVWLSSDLSRVVSCYRSKDKRGPEPVE